MEVKRLDTLVSQQKNRIQSPYTQSTTFIFGNKTGKLLVKQLITSIEDTSRNTTQNHTAINETFRHYHSKLYTTDHDTTSTEADAFLTNVFQN